MVNVHAWAHAMTPGEVVDALDRFPGVGAVLNRGNYDAAADLAVPPIAYVTSLASAEAVARANARWLAIIVNDERNATGPSGAYMTPAEYATAFAPVRDVLRDVAPVHTMGLMSVATAWWHEILWARRFDDAYHERLPVADGRAFNPNKVRRAEIDRVLRMPGPWILSPAPFRRWFDRVRQPVSVRRWVAFAGRENVRAVALWCVREFPKSAGGGWWDEHGLLDRDGRVTVVGRALLAAL